MAALDTRQRLNELVGACRSVKAQADGQAGDVGLWVRRPAGTLAVRLQEELRRLHAAVDVVCEMAEERVRDLDGEAVCGADTWTDGDIGGLIEAVDHRLGDVELDEEFPGKRRRYEEIQRKLGRLLAGRRLQRELDGGS